MNAFESKRERRIERLRARADRLRREGESRVERSHQMASVIPLGQPILVGHHSEGRDRRYRARIERGFSVGYEAIKAADECERRAESAENNQAIFSDDPDAIEKLKTKLGEEESALQTFKSELKRARKICAPRLPPCRTREEWIAALEAQNIDPAIVRFVRHMGSLPTSTNHAANIRRLKSRIAELEAKRSAPEPEPEAIGDIRIEESENRVRVFFADKPTAEVRERLKREGFRWSPSVGAWQRHANPGAWHAARRIATEIVG